MREKQTTSPTQQEQDAFEKSRILSDAELLQGGADIVNGVLRPTGAQLEQMKVDHLSGKEFGRLALYSALDEAANKSVESIVDESENLGRLRAAIDAITAPYATIFDEHIPAPSKDDRNWRGQLKDSVDLKEWQEQRVFAHTTAIYAFEGSYRPGERVNYPQNITMSIKGTDKEKRKPAIKETLAYDHTQLSGVSLVLEERRGRAVTDEQLMKSDGATGALQRFLGAVKIKNGYQDTYTEGGSMTLDFQGEEIVLDGKSNGFIAHAAAFSYVYNAEARMFFADAKTVDNASFPKEIGESDFLNILSDILRFIPTKSLD